MGFGSGVAIFDLVLNTIHNMKLTRQQMVKIVKSLKDALEYADCDTLNESNYIEMDYVKEAFKEDN